MSSPYDAPVTAGPPESQHAPVVVGASLNSRFVARSIDAGIVWGLGLLGFYVTPFVADIDAGHGRELLGVALAAAIVLMGLWSAVQWVSLANTGQTVGRSLTRVRVVDSNTVSPGFVRGVLLREWLFWIPGVLFLAIGIPTGILSLDAAGTAPALPPGTLWETPVAFLGAIAGLRLADFAFAALPGRRCLHDLVAQTRAVHWDERARRVYERSRVYGSMA